MVKRYSDLIILMILWIISIYSVIMVVVKSYNIGFQSYIGYGLLILFTILRFLNIKKFKTLLGIFLMVGTVNAIQFTYFTITIMFTWSPLGKEFSSFGIQPLSLVLFLFFIIINFSDVLIIINRLLNEDNEGLNAKQNQMVEKYYIKLKGENDTRLKEIIDRNGYYQPELVKAAKKVLEDRTRAIKTH